MQAEAALQSLVGLPLASATRAANMLMFDFGSIRIIPSRLDGMREAAEFTLHVQCPWRFCDPQRVLVGYSDIYYPADLPWSEPVPDGFVWDVAGANRCDRFFQAFMAARSTAPLLVASAAADEFGGFRLGFQGGFRLEAFPDTGTPDEVWRLFTPGLKGHFVMPTPTPANSAPTA